MIELTVTDEKWCEFKKDSDIEEYIKFILMEVLSGNGYNKIEDISLGVMCIDDETMIDLNFRFRNEEKPTNVLSLQEIDQSTGYLGDIFLSLETIQKEIAIYKAIPHEYLAFLLIHGTLHILGYDHDTDHKADIMEGLETKMMLRLGFQDPYTTYFAPYEEEKK